MLLYNTVYNLLPTPISEPILLRIAFSEPLEAIIKVLTCLSDWFQDLTRFPENLPISGHLTLSDMRVLLPYPPLIILLKFCPDKILVEYVVTFLFDHVKKVYD